MNICHTCREPRYYLHKVYIADNRLQCGGKSISLGRAEEKILGVFLSGYPWTVADEPALRAVTTGSAGTNTVAVHISRLRDRLATIGLRIRSVRSVGYVLEIV